MVHTALRFHVANFFAYLRMVRVREIGIRIWIIYGSSTFRRANSIPLYISICHRISVLPSLVFLGLPFRQSRIQWRTPKVCEQSAYSPHPTQCRSFRRWRPRKTSKIFNNNKKELQNIQMLSFLTR